jgi:hypothetical protein
MIMKKNKDEILQSLLDNCDDLEIEEKEELKDIANLVSNDTEEDYDFARTRLKALITKSESALDAMLALAEESEHPRAFEVLGGLLKNSSDLMDQLLKLQEKRKKLHDLEGSKSGGNTTNNTVFIGSTTDLQRMIQAENKAPIKNVTDTGQSEDAE